MLAAASPSDASAHPRHRLRHPVAFFIANHLAHGKSRTEAVRRCVAKTHDQQSCADNVVTVRGPYHRGGHMTDSEDNPAIYVYRGSDGVWYDKNGDSPGCDASGCP